MKPRGDSLALPSAPLNPAKSWLAVAALCVAVMANPALAAKPKLLISDEAMAGLSGHEVDEVLDILFDLNKLGITIIMIEHIMQAVMKFSERVICLDAGKIICEGTPETIVKNPEVQRAYLGD